MYPQRCVTNIHVCLYIRSRIVVNNRIEKILEKEIEIAKG